MKTIFGSGRHCSSQERGSILIISAVSMIAFLSFFALVADLGHIFVSKSELQNTADSAAMAAIIEVMNGSEAATQVAVDFGQAHQVAGSPILVNPSDVVFGTYDFDLSEFQPDVLPANAVQVTARKADGALSGPLPLFFANLFGQSVTDVKAVALAILDPRVTGLNFGNQLLPYSVLDDIVDSDGNGEFDVGNIVDIFPGNSAPGNFGFLDLDGGSNGTPDLESWIAEGYAGDFIIPPGGSLEFFGSPGIHGASLLSGFNSIVGQERFLPVHDSTTLQGDNALYNVIAILAVRILEVNLTGSIEDRHIYVEIISFTSSALAIDPNAEVNTTLTKPRLAL